MKTRRGYRPSGILKVLGAATLLAAIWVGVQIGAFDAIGRLLLLPLQPDQSG